MKDYTVKQTDTYNKRTDIRAFSEILSRQSRRYSRIFKEEPEAKQK